MLDVLKETINPDVIIDICDTNRTMLLKETSTDSKVKKLTIKMVPENTFAFTLDHQPGGTGNRYFQQLSCYINRACDNGVNKGCDLVIITEIDIESYNVLIFDLKSEKPRKEATEKQLLNSELFVKYLVSMLKEHCEVKISNIKYRRTIVTTGSRALRKNRVYRRAPLESKTSYKTTNVTVNGAKESCVNFNLL